MRLRRQRWTHGFKGHAGCDKVVVAQPNVNVILKGKNLGGLVLLPAETLFADSQVKAFDEGLLVLLVRESDAMLVGGGRDELSELSLELGAAVGLDEDRPSPPMGLKLARVS